MSHVASRYAVFGQPIAHSLSPAIHQAFARQFHLDLAYTAIEVAPAGFAAAVERFFSAGGAGANVTLPHKRAAFELAAEATDAARRAGTANVLTPLAAGGLEADNTDGAGLVRDITERHREDLRGRDVLLLGAGGAAHGIVWALRDAGVAHVTIANRTNARADELVDRIAEPRFAWSRYWEDLATIGSFNLIINATSAGVTGSDLHLPVALVGPRALCYDLAYGAAAGGFLAWARGAGARLAVDGLGMLVETAADAFTRWHGRRPDTESVYRALHAAAAGARHPRDGV